MDDPFKVMNHPFEVKENPQVYVETPFSYVSQTPARHMLGLVGGNEVSLPVTHSPARQYQAPPAEQTTIYRKNTKISTTIDVRPRHLPAIQMWPYAPTFAPVAMSVQQCGRPEKY